MNPLVSRALLVVTAVVCFVAAYFMPDQRLALVAGGMGAIGLVLPQVGASKGGAALALLFALGTAPALTGCSGAGTSPSTPEGASTKAVVVPGAAALAYNGAAAALLYFDTREAAYVQTLDSSKTAELAAAEHRVQTLEHARAALDIAKGWLEGKNTGEEGRAGIRDAVHVLKLVTAELTNQGRPLPKEVSVGLAAAEAWLVTP